MKNLVKLSVYDLTASNVQRIAVSLSKARDGGVPLLTELSCDVAKYWLDHAADIYPDTVLGVSKHFPELEVLRLCGFAAPVLGRSEYPPPPFRWRLAPLSSVFMFECLNQPDLMLVFVS